jgi:V/A-type H+-transporting ATPase subunit A
MPGEEGYPAYLGSRAAEFYERAGKVICAGTENREGALTAVGAVSPPGGDLSEPVTQATLRIVKVFWGLDASLAYRRHFPAINWLQSYSLYLDRLGDWFTDEVAADWHELRMEAMKLLQEEAELNEIVRLVGFDALSIKDRFTLEVTKTIREDYLHQNAFHEVDTYTSIHKQYRMLKAILLFYHEGQKALSEGALFKELSNIPVREKIAKSKLIPESNVEEFDALEADIRKQVASTLSNGGM